MTGQASYYTYLISSLPMLHFGMKSPFSFENLLEICESAVAEHDLDVLKACKAMDSSACESELSTMKKWRTFDTELKNALVKIRAERMHKDPARYLREDGYQEPYVTTLAMNAYKNTSILESETMLDEERWRALDEMSSGHYFDLDTLVIYAHKLLILEKWDRIQKADRPRMLEEALHEG